MYIICQNADASASNLGNVSIPFNPIQETTDYLSAIDITGFSETKKKAIDTFFRGLKNNGLLNILNRVYLPQLGRVDGGVNMVSPGTDDLTFPTADATYNNNGVRFTTRWNPGFTMNTRDITYAAYNATVGEEAEIRIAIGGNFPNWWLGRGVANSGTLSGLLITTSDRAVVPNRAESVGCMIASYEYNEDILKASVDGEYTEDASVGLSDGGKPTAFSFTLGGGYLSGNINSLQYYPIFAFGTAMTQNQMAVLDGLITSFMGEILP